MALDDITNYLRLNQGKYPREVLLAQLRKAGYPENEIQAAFSQLGSLHVSAPEIKKFSVGGLLVGLLFNLLLLGTGFFSIFILLIMHAFGGKSALASLSAKSFMALTAIAFILPVYLYFRLRSSYPSYARGAIVSIAAAGTILLLALIANLYLLTAGNF